MSPVGHIKNFFTAKMCRYSIETPSLRMAESLPGIFCIRRTSSRKQRTCSYSAGWSTTHKPLDVNIYTAMPFLRSLPLASSLPLSRAFRPFSTRLYSTAAPTSDRVPTNEPSPPAPAPNVSSTNATPVSPMGLRDAPMVESVEEGEQQRQMQAPNRKDVWSRSQARKDEAMSGPRFEQTMMHMQVSRIEKLPLRWRLVLGIVVLKYEWYKDGRLSDLTIPISMI